MTITGLIRRDTPTWLNMMDRSHGSKFIAPWKFTLPWRNERNMFKKKPTRELEVPPIANRNPQAVEVLRVWAAPGLPYQVTLRTTWKDFGIWGLLLADVARHAAKAYENEGHNAAEVVVRIRQLLDAEFANPTDTPVQLT
jgi:hypothetical protein